MFPAIEIGFLLPEIDHNGGPPGMSLRHVRNDHIGHSAAAGEPHSDGRESGEARKSICHGLNRATLEKQTQTAHECFIDDSFWFGDLRHAGESVLRRLRHG
jgi:hypothetical protein